MSEDNTPKKKIYIWWSEDRSKALMIVDHGPRHQTWQAVLWMVGTDQIERGQWLLRRKLDVKRCQLSPDGKLFIAHHCRYCRSGEVEKVMTLSRPPYFTALDGCAFVNPEMGTDVSFDAEKKVLRVSLPSDGVLAILAGVGKRAKKIKDRAERELRQQEYERLLAAREASIRALERESEWPVEMASRALLHLDGSFDPSVILSRGTVELNLPAHGGPDCGWKFVDARLTAPDGRVIFDPRLESFSQVKPPSDYLWCASDGSQCQCLSRDEEKEPCQLKTRTGKCCRCADARTPRQIENPVIFVEGIGDVMPLDYGIQWPVDERYCPSCVSEATRIILPQLYNYLKTASTATHPQSSNEEQ